MGWWEESYEAPLSPRRASSSTEWLLILPPDLSSNASDALRAARADDRLYDLLCLNRLERVINRHALHSAARRRRSWEGGCESAAADKVVKIIMQ